MAIPDIEKSIERIESFDGTVLATAAWGDPNAPTIILSNGIACTDTYWTFLQPRLVEEGFRVIFFDYRGHNRSGRPGNPNEVGLPTHAHDLWVVADHYGVKDAILIGHSMGVQTIFEAFRQQPERVKAIVALAGPFEYPLDNVYMTPIGAVLMASFELTFRHAPRSIRAVWQATGLDTSLMVGFAGIIGAVSRKADKELLNEYFLTVSRLDPLLLIQFFEAMQMHSARDVLPRIKVPVLQIAGGRDVLTPLPLQREMASLLPNVRFETFRRSTHTLPIDEPERLNSRVMEFIWEVESAKSSQIPSPAPTRRGSRGGKLKSVS